MIDPNKLNVYTIRIKSIKAGDFGFGVESTSKDRIWVYNIGKGSVSSSVTPSRNYTQIVPKRGDKIHMYIKDGTIQWTFNGIMLGIAFDHPDLRGDDLRPFVFIHKDGEAVELLPGSISFYKLRDRF